MELEWEHKLHGVIAGAQKLLGIRVGSKLLGIKLLGVRVGAQTTWH